MKKKFKRLILVILTFIPFPAISFAAQSALSIDDIGKPGITDDRLKNDVFKCQTGKIIEKK
jgi:hypothetical protein